MASSATAGVLMHGAHWLEGWPVTQKVRALSSAESGFLFAGPWSSTRAADETHVSRSWRAEEITGASLRFCCKSRHDTKIGSWKMSTH